MSFKFNVGQAVEYRPMGGQVARFTVVRRMPEEHGATDLKYRIKSSHESFERSVMQCDLAIAERPESEYSAIAPIRRAGGH